MMQRDSANSDDAELEPKAAQRLNAAPTTTTGVCLDDWTSTHTNA